MISHTEATPQRPDENMPDRDIEEEEMQTNEKHYQIDQAKKLKVPTSKEDSES